MLMYSRIGRHCSGLGGRLTSHANIRQRETCDQADGGCGSRPVLAACGGGGAGAGAPVHPANTASARGRRASCRRWPTATSTEMATLWGTAAGPAARTRQPADYERRIAVMQAYLRNDDSPHRLRHPGRPAARVTPSRSSSGGSSAPGSCRSSPSSSATELDREPGRSDRGRQPGRPCNPGGASTATPHHARSSGGNLRPSPLLSYSVSSSRMPAVAFGCTKAMRRPPAPMRGISSIRR